MANPVGLLQELCIIKRLPPPFYDLENFQGLQHDIDFTISCKVLSYSETGSGKSKKQAKKIAAYRMLQALQETSNEINDTKQYEEDEEKRFEPILTETVQKHRSIMKNYKVNTIANTHELGEFKMELEESDSEWLNERQETSLPPTDFDCVGFLSDLAKKQQFEITYIDIGENSVPCRSKYLLRLSIVPLLVCSGTGKTAKEAQNSAALNALECLKIITGK